MKPLITAPPSIAMPEGLFGDANHVRRYCKDNVQHAIARNSPIEWGPLRPVEPTETVMYGARQVYRAMSVWRVGLVIEYIYRVLERRAGDQRLDARELLLETCDNLWCAIALFGDAGFGLMLRFGDRTTHLTVVERHLAAIGQMGDVFSELETLPGPIVTATFGRIAAQCFKLGVDGEEIKSWKSAADVRVTIRAVLGLDPVTR